MQQQQQWHLPLNLLTRLCTAVFIRTKCAAFVHCFVTETVKAYAALVHVVPRYGSTQLCPHTEGGGDSACIVCAGSLAP